MLKTNIVRQKFNVAYDKNKNLVLRSIKIFSNSKTREDRAILTRSQVNELLRAKQRETFMHILTKKYDVIAKLKCDAQAKKAQLCKNTAYCTTADNVARFLHNESVQYVNKHTRLQSKKTAKKAVKKTVKRIVKKAVKKTAKKS